MTFLQADVVQAGRKVLRSFYYLIALLAAILGFALHAADLLWEQLDDVYQRQTRHHQPTLTLSDGMLVDIQQFLLEKNSMVIDNNIEAPMQGIGMDAADLLFTIERKLNKIRASALQSPQFEMRFESVLDRVEFALVTARGRVVRLFNSRDSLDQDLSPASLHDAMMPLQLPLQQLKIMADLSNETALTQIRQLQDEARKLWAGIATAFVLIVIVIGAFLLRQMRRNLRELEVANEAKSMFLATVSHEIRTPLNAIRGGLGLLSTENLSHEDRDLLRVMHGSSDVLLSVVNDFLDFAKIEAGKLTVEAVNMRPAELVDDVVRLMTVRAFDHETHLSTIIDPHTPREIMADAKRLRQILINIVSNAIKFTPRGNVVVHVRQVSESRLRIVVEDDGPGIPEDRQPRLFNEFERLETTLVVPQGGAGLGLAISKRLVNLLGGSIGVKSEVGQGSTFWFEVPCDVPEPEILQPGGHDEFDDLSVLIVGSDMPWRAAMAQQLELWGMRVTCVNWEEIQNWGGIRDGGFGLARFELMIVGARPNRVAELPAALGALRGQGTKLVSFARAFGPIEQHDSRVNVADYLLRLPVTNENLWRCISETTGRVVHNQPQSSSLAAANVPLRSAVSSVRILLAEDGQANQMVAAAMLRNLGYQVDTVGTGHEAVAAVSSLPYDVVLMDLSMPDMDGFEATRRIRRLGSSHYNVPIIAVTAHGGTAIQQACLDAGMNAFIPKPIDPLALSASIEECVLSVDEATQPQQAVRVESSTLERIDRHAIDRLEEDTSSELLPHMVETFVKEMNGQARVIASAIESGELQILARESHVLKSSADLFGARIVCTLAKDLNLACNEENQADAVKLASQLIDEIALSAATFNKEYLDATGLTT